MKLRSITITHIGNFAPQQCFPLFMDMIVNKVAESGIVTIDLATYAPAESTMAVFDLKPYLFKEMILREKDYRTALQTTDWQQFAGKNVTITCTTDAIIPAWAFMLAAIYLEPIAGQVVFGTADELTKQLYIANIYNIPKDNFADVRVVVKGCGEVPIPDYAYVAITTHLKGVAKSIMYGEPCSTVPLYKRSAPKAPTTKES